MSDEIFTRPLAVSYHKDDRGPEGLVYKIAPTLPDEPPPPAVYRSVAADTFRQDIDDVRRRLGQLIRLAESNRNRNGLGIELPSQTLARHVLPEGGFDRVLPPGLHPQFDVGFDAASEIPWEVLEEPYFVCNRCNSRRQPVLPGAEGAGEVSCRQCGAMLRDLREVCPACGRKPEYHCPLCGHAMHQVAVKLALDRHLVHLVRARRRSVAEGMNFLIVEDPTGELCCPQFDPQRICAEHVSKLQAMLQRHGYQVVGLPGKNATVHKVIEALRDRALVGAYFFCHGYLSQQGNEGCLVLADGHLHATRIAELAHTAQLVFLNACEGAATGRNWSLERKLNSVGHAFAQGIPIKTVIAPLCPVVNVQAARAALEFFEIALSGQSLGESLCQVRQKSLARYEQDQPDISWMAYRFFGNPNRVLQTAKDRSPAAVPAGPAQPGSRLFGPDEQLDAERFGFDVAEVLLRAAKRRNLDGRARISTGDFLAGLIRIGGLIRYALREHQVDPDELYRQIGAEEEAGPRYQGPDPLLEALRGAKGAASIEQPAAEDPATRRRLLERWIPTARDQLTDQLIAVLEQAEAQAQRRIGGQAAAEIAEQDVLEAMTWGGQWAAGLRAPLPPATPLRQWLARREQLQVVDQNGRLLLDGLDAAARRVLEHAHVLAEQRGRYPIPNRLTLAALLIDSDGYGAQLCRRHGVDAKALAALLIEATEVESPRSFVLGGDSCRGVVLPMLQQARRLQAASGESQLSEPMLFQAYCRMAPEGLKQALRGLPPPLRADLDQLGAEPLPAALEAHR